MSSQRCTSGYIKLLNIQKAGLGLTGCKSRGGMKKRWGGMLPTEGMGKAVIFLVY